MLPGVTMSPPVGLQRSDVVDAAQHDRALPLGVLQRAGEHVLRNAVEVIGDGRRVVGLQRPVAAHLLERHPPEHRRIGGLALLARRRLDARYIVLAAGGIEPSPRSPR
jgi:hypothetical protein